MNFDQMQRELEQTALDLVRQCTDAELKEAARLATNPAAILRIARVWRERHPTSFD